MHRRRQQQQQQRPGAPAPAPGPAQQQQQQHAFGGVHERVAARLRAAVDEELRYLKAAYGIAPSVGAELLMSQLMAGGGGGGPLLASPPTRAGSPVSQSGDDDDAEALERPASRGGGGASASASEAGGGGDGDPEFDARIDFLVRIYGLRRSDAERVILLGDELRRHEAASAQPSGGSGGLQPPPPPPQQPAHAAAASVGAGDASRGGEGSPTSLREAHLLRSVEQLCLKLRLLRPRLSSTTASAEASSGLPRGSSGTPELGPQLALRAAPPPHLQLTGGDRAVAWSVDGGGGGSVDGEVDGAYAAGGSSVGGLRGAYASSLTSDASSAGGGGGRSVAATAAAAAANSGRAARLQLVHNTQGLAAAVASQPQVVHHAHPHAAVGRGFMHRRPRPPPPASLQSSPRLAHQPPPPSPPPTAVVMGVREEAASAQPLDPRAPSPPPLAPPPPTTLAAATGTTGVPAAPASVAAPAAQSGVKRRASHDDHIGGGGGGGTSLLLDNGAPAQHATDGAASGAAPSTKRIKLGDAGQGEERGVAVAMGADDGGAGRASGRDALPVEPPSNDAAVAGAAGGDDSGGSTLAAAAAPAAAQRGGGGGEEHARGASVGAAPRVGDKRPRPLEAAAPAADSNSHGDQPGAPHAGPPPATALADAVAGPPDRALPSSAAGDELHDAKRPRTE